MIYRTLIIFDTNRIDHMDYDGFKIGGDYNAIKSFIKNNKLEDLIHIAIPEFVIKEIARHKIEKFKDELKEYKRIGNKLRKLSIISLEEEINFDIEKYLKDELAKYTEEQGLKIIKLPRIRYESTLEKIIQRAISKELPFKENKKHSDMGFKDVLIWETILNSKNLILDYDNVFYCSGDNGFSECKREFEKIINRNFEQFNSESYLIERIKELYSNLILNNKIYQFVRTAYFREMLEQKIDEQHWVEIKGEDKEIERFEIIDICNQIEINDYENDVWFEITSQLLLEIDGEESEFFSHTIINEANEIITIDIEKIDE